MKPVFKEIEDVTFEPVQPTVIGVSVLEIRSPIFKRIMDTNCYPTVIHTGLSLDLPTGYVGIITESTNDDEDWFPHGVCSAIYSGGEIYVRIHPRLSRNEYMDIQKGDVIAHMIIQKVEQLSLV